MTITSLDQRHIWHPYTQEKTALPPILIVRGKGAVLTDVEGNEYLDLVSSWWVNTHGHAHPKIAKAIADQAKTLEHVIFANMTHEPAARLAEQLTSLLPELLTRVFFSDNGSTAVEVALKMARQYWCNLGETKRHRYVAFEKAYHGDTFGAMAAGKSSGFYRPFEPYLFDVTLMPYPETWMADKSIEEKEVHALSFLENYLEKYASETVALIVEPLIQGASGMRFCRPSFLKQVCERVQSHGILVIFDEVMTGFGRTGELFACQKVGVTPDLICLAKGLTGGFLPMSVTVAQEKIYEAFLGDSFDQAFAHGHSFTANPLGCAAALANLALFEEEKTMTKIAQMEQLHYQHLTKLQEAHPCVTKTRIMGSIAAFTVETSEEGYQAQIGQQLRQAFIEKGLLLRPLGPVVYFLPPYCLTEEQLYRAYEGIGKILGHVFTKTL